MITLFSCHTCGSLITPNEIFCNLCKSPVQYPIIPIPIAQTSSVCFYHPFFRATFICNRCGRSICVYCHHRYSGLNLCPMCFVSIKPPTPYYLAFPLTMPYYRR